MLRMLSWALVALSCSFCCISANTLPRQQYGNYTQRLFLDGNDDISFIAIGDWGSRRDRQEQVAKSMGEWCSQDSFNCDFIISTGDNIYSDGVTSVSDHHFDDTWREIYTYPGIADLQWYLTVGNHDHHSENGEWFQVEYSMVNERWNMPALAYAFEVATQDITVKFVSVDTISIHDDINDADGQLSLLRRELESANDADWKIVFSHFPTYSGGHYAGSHTIRSKVLPILEDNQVDFYLTGHDHNQQHWQERGNPDGIEHIVTGAGGMSRYGQHDDTTQESLDRGMDLKHFFEGYGFAHFHVTKGHISVRFVDIYGDVAHYYTRHH